jgi:hypothetical protein
MSLMRSKRGCGRHAHQAMGSCFAHDQLRRFPTIGADRDFGSLDQLLSVGSQPRDHAFRIVGCTEEADGQSQATRDPGGNRNRSQALLTTIEWHQHLGHTGDRVQAHLNPLCDPPAAVGSE